MSGTTQTSAAVQSVTGATDLAGTSVMDMSAWGMFIHADIVVKSVMLLLLLASMWSWAIIFAKIAKFGDVKGKAARFEQEFWAADTLDAFYEKMKRRANHPMCVVFMAAMEEWMRSGKSRTRGAVVLAASGIDRIANHGRNRGKQPNGGCHQCFCNTWCYHGKRGVVGMGNGLETGHHAPYGSKQPY